jgi:hypothetical protein
VAGTCSGSPRLFVTPIRKAPGFKTDSAPPTCSKLADMVTVACGQCGKQFKVTPSRLKQKRLFPITCSYECAHKIKLGKSPNPDQPDAGSKLVICESCGKEFRIAFARLRQLRGGRFACSSECSYKLRIGVVYGRVEPKTPAAERSKTRGNYSDGTEEWRARQRDRVRAWRARNRKRANELSRQHNKRLRERQPDYFRKRALADYHKDVKKSRQKLRERHARLRQAALSHYGRQCALCGESRQEFLTVDHIGGGGTQHRQRLVKANKNFFRWLSEQKYPDGFRTLCMNCNFLEGRRRPSEEWKTHRQRAFYERKRAQVLTHYGGKCACCSETRREVLCVDHIKGGGVKHRKQVKRRGHTFYAWLVRQRFPPEYRLLCQNCNFAFGHYGYCPHQSNDLAARELARVSESSG